MGNGMGGFWCANMCCDGEVCWDGEEVGNGLLLLKSKVRERVAGAQGSCSIKGLAVAAALGLCGVSNLGRG
jgi:hypothetical protein